jgi:hypothetical protein
MAVRSQRLAWLSAPAMALCPITRTVPGNFTPAQGDDTQVSFGYVISDGTLNVAGTATRDLTPVGEAPTNQAPIVAGPLAAGANEGNAPFELNLLNVASDANGDTLFVTGLSFTINNYVESGSALPTGFSLEGSTLSVGPASEAFGYLAPGESPPSW